LRKLQIEMQGLASPLQITLLFGGRSGEHEVSLMSARSVLAALNPAKYAITPVGVTHAGEWLAGEGVLEAFERGEYQDLTPVILAPDPTWSGLWAVRTGPEGQALEYLTGVDVVIPVIHGTFGEDGALQGLLELAGLAYVGAGVLASAVAMDKALFKEVMRAEGIPVLDSILALRSEISEAPQAVIERAERLAPYPLFVKPANLGSSVGISRCTSRSDLYEGLLEAARFDRRVLIERGIQAREIEVSVLGNEHPAASAPGEVLPSREFYSYEAKYVDGTSGLLIPAPLAEEVAEQVRDLALRAFQAMDGAGMARADFLLDKDTGELFLNEVNTIPGFTSISMYAKLWEASGLPYAQLLDRLIELALERKADRDRTERRYQKEA
jgi:D-alanine-D-alanine ligase